MIYLLYIMPIVKIIEGDLLKAKEYHIAQQCNCVTVRSHGLSKSIANKWPDADIYAKRKSIKGRNCAITRSIPGTIQKCNAKNKVIICMFAQYCPGKVGHYSRVYGSNETSEDRQKWFLECLNMIDNDDSINEVAMPYLIGCGLAGGNWDVYKKMLNNTKTHIVLYKL